MKQACDVSWVTVQLGLLFNSGWLFETALLLQTEGKASTEHFGSHSKGLMSNLGLYVCAAWKQHFVVN